MRAAGPLLRLSLRRVRSRPLRTGLSVVAVAGGVAFVLAVQVINSGPEAAYRQLERAVAGEVDRYMVSRTDRGVPDAVFSRVRRLPSVAAAAPTSQQLVRLSSETGSARVGLIGVDRRIRSFRARIAESGVTEGRDESAIGVYLPERVAEQLSVGVGDRVTVRFGERVRTTLVAGVLDGQAADALKSVSVALAPLGLAQSLTGTEGRITRILLKLRGEPTPATAAALQRAGGGLLDVTRVGTDAKMLSSAFLIERQTASLFAMLALLIGGLLVYNASMLSALEWRRDVAVMRTLGGSRRLLLAHAVAESLAIGLVGSLLGVVLGQLLLTFLAGDGPQIVSEAFLVNADAAVPAWMAVLALFAGTLVAVLGATIPTATLLRAERFSLFERDTMAPDMGTKPSKPLFLMLGAAACAAGAGLAVAMPAQTPLGIALLVLGGGLLMPSVARWSLRLARQTLPRTSATRLLGIAELTAVPSRATALASIAALSLGALVLIGGTATNLKAAGAEVAQGTFGSADLWLSVDSAENRYGTESFDGGWVRRMNRVPGVKQARPYRLTFLDFHGRRVMALGYAPGVVRTLNSSEFVRGDRDALSRGLPKAGDVALSYGLARSEGLRLGQSFVLPTPTGPQRVRYVATVANYGWQAGAITMGWRSLARIWGADDVSMVGIDLAPGADEATVKRNVLAVIGPDVPLRVETVSQGEARTLRAADLGLQRVRQIAFAILIGAVLAISASMLTAIMQRRRRIAGLRALGMSRSQAFGALLAEVSFVLAIGAIVGILLGIVGQILIVRWSFTTAGFPIRFAPNLSTFLSAAAAMGLIALVSTVVSARSAFRRPISEGLMAE